MFNADGSESEMCGNGVRCVAKYVYDHGIARKPRVTIETGRGVLTLDLEVEEGKVRRVRVDMGAPILQGADIPTTLPGDPPVNVPARRSPGIDLAVTAVSMGNPHAVVYVDDVASFPVETVGAAARAPPGLPPTGQRPLRRGHRSRRGPDADLGARLGDHPGLRHRAPARSAWPAS